MKKGLGLQTGTPAADPWKGESSSHHFLTSFLIFGGQSGVALDRKEGK